MKYLLNIIYTLGLILYSPLLLYRMIFQNRYKTGWGWRFGNVQRKYPHKKCIWIHAVSVGEVNSTKTLVEHLANKLEDHEIIISTTTDTGLARATALYGKEHLVFIFPFDFSFAVQKAFKNLTPSICVLMELEVWPNFVKTAHNNNIPVIVANGRISDKSFPTYRKVRPLIKPIFKKLDLVLAQTRQYADRFIELGCQRDNVIVSGSLKYDTAEITDTVEGSDKIKNLLNLTDKRLIVAGGTGPGEETLLCEVFDKLIKDNIDEKIVFAIVPRKPERFDEVAELIKKYDSNFVRFSDHKNSENPRNDNYRFILVDTMGDLRKFYSLSEINFVGRSLVPMGGSDMIESAALGKPTMFGTHTQNFKQTVDALLSVHGAIEVKDTQQLYQSLKRCLVDPDYASEFGEHGQRVIIENKGATRKTADAICKLCTARQII